ncbi:MAG: T9SS type A sorting domain-containing protein [Saprospiraceae bacterium]|nr:T9SS type A sorting domain-containing protein [Saprospiraceae bacterium]
MTVLPNVVCYADTDGDGFGDPNSIMTFGGSCGMGFVADNNDCDDNSSTINPNATEICNGVDDNCDTEIDEGVLTTYYQDLDGDTFGNPSVTQQACSPPEGYVTNFNDCNDNDALAPAVTFTRDTLAIQDFELTPALPTWSFTGPVIYNSGFSGANAAPDNSPIGISGSRAWETTSNSGGLALEFDNINIPAGYDSVRVQFRLAAMNLNSTGGGPDNLDYVLTQVSLDNGTTYYSRLRIRGAVADNSYWAYDATGVAKVYYQPQTEVMFQPINTGLATDLGYSTCEILFPGNVSQVKIKITGRSSSSTDTWMIDNVLIAGEIINLDADCDGYASDTDCNDNNPAINPAATEICDGVDNDCDGLMDEGLTFVIYYPDTDGDGYGTGAGTSLCTNPGTGFVTLGGDCNDSNPDINPGETEVCDGMDNDCDMLADEGLTFTTYYTDADGDGYGTGAGQSLCANPGVGFATQAGDCADGNPTVNPGEEEICNNEIDDNCNLQIDENCCDLLISNTTSTAPSCPGGSNGTITVSSSSSSGPVNYAISGPVNQNNQSGLFTGLPAGFYSISVTDAAMCSQSSLVTVAAGMDSTPPTVMCFNQTINFNGESSILLNTAALASYSDNCGIQSVTLSPNSISSSQVGQTIPVLVTVTDNSGNTATCTSQITANGLPPGWSQNVNGVGCNNGSNIQYNPSTEVWTATSSNCYYSAPFTSDQTAFAQRTLCGNGSITAEVTGISGTSLGWAGIVMRESNAPGSKKVQIMTNLSNFLRREIRSVTNGPAQPQQFQAFNRYWLRLTRTGSQIVAHSSSDGINWVQVLAVTLPMNSCIEMGLVVTNYNQNSTVTATFENVSYTGSGPLPVSPVSGNAVIPYEEQYQPNFSVYPNPTSGELNIDLKEYIGKNVQIELYSLEGKLMQLISMDEVSKNTQTMLLDRYSSGIYFVKLRSKGLPDMTKRVVLTKG